MPIKTSLRFPDFGLLDAASAAGAAAGWLIAG
jgi:hypothetical protein